MTSEARPILMDVIRDCSPTRPKLTKISDRHPKSVLEQISQLRRGDDFLCDVILNVGTSRIKAHKIILCASSPYFKAMFTNELAEFDMAKNTKGNLKFMIIIK
ncbi:kelch diablo isoform X1 [Brachionus plicatilis]|uniref:Kelch diablo isoform X1 n=1 Tax=Brachionus plicatilis TaxID=10195 RepID=A0A3M7RSM4_BRAPC|nr:kelch diablo isoform X1 [Brachionus plicatilis]